MTEMEIKQSNLLIDWFIFGFIYTWIDWGRWFINFSFIIEFLGIDLCIKLKNATKMKWISPCEEVDWKLPRAISERFWINQHNFFPRFVFFGTVL